MATTQVQETTTESQLPASTIALTSIGFIKLGGIMPTIAVAILGS